MTAERAGIHSIWYPDHVCMPYDSESFHTANVSGQRAYQRRHNMLDAAVVMGAVAVQTTTLKLGTSVLIAPYRHPLSDARQFMTVDQLSNGRLMLGVGVGWMVEEFDAVGIDFEERNRRTEECIQIYKASWTGDLATFEGNYYSFRNVSQDPKPAQQSPHPPIVFGGNTIRGARRAARFCDGLYPLFLDTYTEAGRYAPLQDEVRRELEARGKSPSDFLMQCAASARITDTDDPAAQANPRRTCTGTAEQILGDLSDLADARLLHGGVLMLSTCSSGCDGDSEQRDQIERFGAEVIPEGQRSSKPAAQAGAAVTCKGEEQDEGAAGLDSAHLPMSPCREMLSGTAEGTAISSAQAQRQGPYLQLKLDRCKAS